MRPTPQDSRADCILVTPVAYEQVGDKMHMDKMCMAVHVRDEGKHNDVMDALAAALANMLAPFIEFWNKMKRNSVVDRTERMNQTQLMFGDTVFGDFVNAAKGFGENIVDVSKETAQKVRDAIVKTPTKEQAEAAKVNERKSIEKMRRNVHNIRKTIEMHRLETERRNVEAVTGGTGGIGVGEGNVSVMDMRQNQERKRDAILDAREKMSRAYENPVDFIFNP